MQQAGNILKEYSNILTCITLWPHQKNILGGDLKEKYNLYSQDEKMNSYLIIM